MRFRDHAAKQPCGYLMSIEAKHEQSRGDLVWPSCVSGRIPRMVPAAASCAGARRRIISAASGRLESSFITDS